MSDGALRPDAEPESVRARYGWNTFGQSCLLARRLVQHGVRLTTVNMFDTVFGQLTWDCHANGGDLSTTLEDSSVTLTSTFSPRSSAIATFSALRARSIGRSRGSQAISN